LNFFFSVLQLKENRFRGSPDNEATFMEYDLALDGIILAQALEADGT
jgi:hypothetical protein